MTDERLDPAVRGISRVSVSTLASGEADSNIEADLHGVAPEDKYPSGGKNRSYLGENSVASYLRLLFSVIGAEEGTRTPTPLRVRGPEPRASANSATSARDTNPAVSAGSAATLSLAKPASRVKFRATSSDPAVTSASALPTHPASAASPNPAAATGSDPPAPFRPSGTSRSNSSRYPRSESAAPSRRTADTADQTAHGRPSPAGTP